LPAVTNRNAFPQAARGPVLVDGHIRTDETLIIEKRMGDIRSGRPAPGSHGEVQEPTKQ